MTAKQLEVEWTHPKSGITTISLSDLSCKNAKEWNALSRDEQQARITKWQRENEARDFKQIDWYLI